MRFDIVKQLAVLPLLVFTFAQCSSSSGGDGNCTTDLNVAGVWDTTFTCTGPASPGGTDVLTVTQDGTDVTFVYEPGNGGDGSTFTGSLCDTTFTWDGGLENSFSENGTWEFTSESTITKETEYENANGGGEGNCTGTGTRR